MTSDPDLEDRRLVGMVHLPALPGAPGYEGSREAIRERAVRDARELQAGGMDAVLVENFGDAPFYPEETPRHVLAEMTAVVRAVREAVDLPVGVNVLRNDVEGAISVAAATGGSFVRANVHVGAAVTDQGLLEGRAHETIRHRDRIDADVAVWADVGVKHATPLGDRTLEAELREAIERGRADAAIVSGPETGAPTPESTLRRARETLQQVDREVPLVVGSGVTPETVPAVLEVADVAIVGTALKENGVTTNPVDRARVRDLVDASRE